MKWDFSKVKVRLVPSLAGKHEGWHNVSQSCPDYEGRTKPNLQVLHSGHTGLMKAVRDLNLRTPKGKELILECQVSVVHH